MESFINGAELIEATLASFLLALWVTWIGLRGLFRLMPGRRLEVVPIRLAAGRGAALAVGGGHDAGHGLSHCFQSQRRCCPSVAG